MRNYKQLSQAQKNQIEISAFDLLFYDDIVLAGMGSTGKTTILQKIQDLLE